MSTRTQLIDRSFTVEIVAFQKSMLDDFRALHSELLPVQYDDKFYRQVSTLPNYISVVAIIHHSTPTNNNDNNDANNNDTKQHDAIHPLRPLPIIVGVATGRVRELDSYCTTPNGYIMTLGTSKNYRGKGIGGQLLDALITRLREYGAVDISLHCTTTNESAIALYHTRNFQLVERLERHYYFHDKKHDAYQFISFGERSCNSLCCRVIKWFQKLLSC